MILEGSINIQWIKNPTIYKADHLAIIHYFSSQLIPNPVFYGIFAAKIRPFSRNNHPIFPSFSYKVYIFINIYENCNPINR